MNINKRAASILLLLLFCFTFSHPLLAQTMDELKELIRVDVQTFMTESKINHGYYVFRCKIQNRDSKPHKVTLSCDRVASKSFDLPAGETINASLPLPVTNPSFGNAIKVMVDNREMENLYCPMRIKHYYSSYSSYGHYYKYSSEALTPLLDSNTFMACRSLRRNFPEADCIFAECDCKLWPQDRLDYSCLDFILLTPSELSAAPAGVQTALRQFVSSGGVLWLFDCKNQKEELDKIEWITQLKNDTNKMQKTLDNDESQFFVYPLAFGRVILFNFSPEEFHQQKVPQNSNSDKTILLDLYEFSGNLPSREVSWFNHDDLSEWQKKFPIVDDLGIPRAGILIVIFLFVLLAGPVNLYILNKHNKRIWLLVTVPILSFLFAGAILLYVVLSEGFNTETRLCVIDYLDQRDGTYASMTQMGVYARTSPSNVVYDAEDELNIIEDNIKTDRLNIDWTSGKQVIHSNFAPVRNPAYYKIRKTGTTRLNLDFDFNAAYPYVVNGLGKDIEQLYVRGADGTLWKAENIGAGEKATLTFSNTLEETNYKTVSEFQSLISESNWSVVAFSLKKSPGNIPPNCYVATFHSPGPFSNKGIPYANEKRTTAFLLGRF